MEVANMIEPLPTGIVAQPSSPGHDQGHWQEPPPPRTVWVALALLAGVAVLGVAFVLALLPRLRAPRS